MIVYFPVCVFILGIVLYYAAKAETKEIGRIFIWTSCLTILLRGLEPLIKIR